jgi:hypothetical protein
MRHWSPVFVKPSKLPSIRPSPSSDANVVLKLKDGKILEEIGLDDGVTAAT